MSLSFDYSIKIKQLYETAKYLRKFFLKEETRWIHWVPEKIKLHPCMTNVQIELNQMTRADPGGGVPRA